MRLQNLGRARPVPNTNATGSGENLMWARDAAASTEGKDEQAEQVASHGYDRPREVSERIAIGKRYDGRRLLAVSTLRQVSAGGDIVRALASLLVFSSKLTKKGR